MDIILADRTPSNAIAIPFHNINDIHWDSDSNDITVYYDGESNNFQIFRKQTYTNYVNLLVMIAKGVSVVIGNDVAPMPLLEGGE